MELCQLFNRKEIINIVIMKISISAFRNDWVIFLCSVLFKVDAQFVRFNATTEVKRQTTLVIEMQWMTSCCSILFCSHCFYSTLSLSTSFVQINIHFFGITIFLMWFFVCGQNHNSTHCMANKCAAGAKKCLSHQNSICDISTETKRNETKRISKFKCNE